MGGVESQVDNRDGTAVLEKGSIRRASAMITKVQEAKGVDGRVYGEVLNDKEVGCRHEIVDSLWMVYRNS